MPNAATQETPFFLVHGAEAVLPVEITHEAPRITTYDETTSTEALQDDVDALNEARDVALTRATQYQQCLMTQTGRTWQITVPMGGTLHHDRSNTQRSLSTTRQENRDRREQPVECRTTMLVLCIEGVW
jgi:hypothetical protein